MSILILSKSDPTSGVFISPTPRHAKLLAAGFVLSKTTNKEVDPYFPNFSIQLTYQLFKILDLQGTTTKVETQL